MFWITVLISLALDRLSKYLVVKNMFLGESIPIIQDFFHITYVQNAGAAFGMLSNKRWFFIIVTLIILAILIYFTMKEAREKPLLKLTLGMIAGGAVGNLLDRIQTGLVIDFIDFRGIWPYIFNIADTAVVVGVIILALQILFEERLGDV